MKYKLQLILTAFGILLTTVCHGQTAGTVIAAHVQTYSNGSMTVVDIQLPNNHTIRVGCPTKDTTCLMPFAGTTITRLEVNFVQFYEGTNIALLWKAQGGELDYSVGFYVLLSTSY